MSLTRVRLFQVLRRRRYAVECSDFTAVPPDIVELDGATIQLLE